MEFITKYPQQGNLCSLVLCIRCVEQICLLFFYPYCTLIYSIIISLYSSEFRKYGYKNSKSKWNLHRILQSNCLCHILTSLSHFLVIFQRTCPLSFQYCQYYLLDVSDTKTWCSSLSNISLIFPIKICLSFKSRLFYQKQCYNSFIF